MSEENLEVVRGILEEWGKGNFQGRNMLDISDPNTLFVLRPEFPEAGAYRGPEEIREYMRGFLDAWERLVIEGEEFTAAGDSVVVSVHQRGTGKESGIPVELHYFQVWTFRGRTLVRLETMMQRSEALEAAGLEA